MKDHAKHHADDGLRWCRGCGVRFRLDRPNAVFCERCRCNEHRAWNLEAQPGKGRAA
jgi:hypothetical protein